MLIKLLDILDEIVYLGTVRPCQSAFCKRKSKVSYQLSLDEDAITMDYLGKEAVLPLQKRRITLF